MFVTRKKMKKVMVNTYDRGFHAGKLYGVAKMFKMLKGGKELEATYNELVNEEEVVVR